MRYFRYRPLVLGALLFSLLLARDGQAQSGAVPPVIAIVDYAWVLTKSTAAQAIKNQIVAERTKLEKQGRELDAQLRKREQELARQQKVITKEQFDQLRNQFFSQIKSARDALQVRIQKIGNARARARGRIEEEIGKIVKRIASDRGYNLVLVGRAVIIMDTSMDISKDVLAELNKKLPRVQVKFTE